MITHRPKARPLTFEQAKAKYPHRFTMEHVPAWAAKPVLLGEFLGGIVTRDGYAPPQYVSDREWYETTLFYGEGEKGLATRKFCYATPTWPLGKALLHVPFTPNKKD